MKLVYYLPSLEAPGGLEHIITYKANYFTSIGYDVTIITSEQGNRPVFYSLLPSVKHIDLNVPFDYPYNQSLIIKLLKYPIRYHKFKKRLTSTLQKLQADITISTLRRELNFISDIKDGSIKVGEFHITRNSYGVGSLSNKNILISYLKTYWNKRFIKNIAKLSKFVLLTHEEYDFWPELNNKIVIPNPVVISPSDQSTCNSIRVIAAGRYANQKGFDLLIDSWLLVTKKHPGWSLHIFGDGSLRSDLQKQINNLNLQACCVLEQTSNNITKEYCNSSIFVLSSRYEGFGMVLTEAMSCGLPIISFACPCGPKDIIDDNVTGFLIEKENVEEMAEKICYLIENEAIRKKMGEEAYKSSHKYAMKNIAKKWISLFNTLKKES